MVLAEPYGIWLLIAMISSLLQLGWLLAGLIIFHIIRFTKVREWVKKAWTDTKGFLGYVYRKLLTTKAVRRLVNDLGYGYDSEQDIFYSTLDAWQRKYGYCRLYDESSALSGMIVDCEPITFDYKGKHWLIEFWKGQYDMAMGFEIGVYNTTHAMLSIPDVFNGSFYESAKDDELLHMYGALYKNRAKLFQREDKHWWLTAFKVGEFAEPSELALDIRIEFPESAMRDAFERGLIQAGYRSWDYDVSGRTVSLLFEKPKTAQPYTRTKELESVIQWKNKALCDAFQSLIGDAENTPRGINTVRRKEAGMYSKILEMGRSEKNYELYKTLQAFLPADENGKGV
jgi:hypothetical protein